MADVRLTATNPDDSTVVPVACNAKGELLLDAPPNNGVVDGDLTVSGTGNFGGTVYVADIDVGEGVKLDTKGEVVVRQDVSERYAFAVTRDANNSENFTATIKGNGSAEFKNNVAIGDYVPSVSSEDGCYIYANGSYYANRTNGSSSVFAANNDGSRTITLFADGGADFAGGTDLGSTTNDGLRISNEGEVTIQRSSGSDLLFRGYDSTTNSVQVFANGAASLAGGRVFVSSGGTLLLDNGGNAVSSAVTKINSNGLAEFGSEVTVTSRGQKWVLTEQGGICYMMSPSLRDDGFSQTPPRDVIKEIDYLKDLVQALYERLKMSPESGWDVWDGSD